MLVCNLQILIYRAVTIPGTVRCVTIPKPVGANLTAVAHRQILIYRAVLVVEQKYCITFKGFPKGERADRRQWRRKGGERVAAVGRIQACFVRRSFCRAPQQESNAAVGCLKKRVCFPFWPSGESEDHTEGPRSASLLPFLPKQERKAPGRAISCNRTNPLRRKTAI